MGETDDKKLTFYDGMVAFIDEMSDQLGNVGEILLYDIKNNAKYCMPDENAIKQKEQEKEEYSKRSEIAKVCFDEATEKIDHILNKEPNAAKATEAEISD